MFGNKKVISCPVCLGRGIENSLRLGSVLCYYCHGGGQIGWIWEPIKKEGEKNEQVSS